jgi:glutathione S-transferase
MRLKIYGDSISGNCLKVKWTAERLGLDYEWIEIDLLKGETQTPQFRAINPAGQVPVVVLSDGRPLAQSNAIILHLAEGSDLIPADSYARGRMLEWMFWEQYSHEPYVAVARFHVVYQGRAAADLDPKLVAKGEQALQRLEDGLEGAQFLVGDQLSLADIALVAYTRLAGEGGFDLARYPKVQAWIARVEAALPITS